MLSSLAAAAIEVPIAAIVGSGFAESGRPLLFDSDIIALPQPTVLDAGHFLECKKYDLRQIKMTLATKAEHEADSGARVAKFVCITR